VIFTSEQDGNQEVYIMDLTGKWQQNLTNFPLSDKEPAWQPLPFIIQP
jgi:Tol biopolymer transport system component